MKPWRETLRVDGIVDASVDRAWALRTDPAAQVEAFSHRVEVTALVGRPGEVGAVTRHVNRLEDGRVASTMSTVREVDRPRRIVLDGYSPEAPQVRTVTTVGFRPLDGGTRLEVEIEFHVAETTWLQRYALGRTRARRRAEGERLFALELAEENAYHRAHRD